MTEIDHTSDPAPAETEADIVPNGAFADDPDAKFTYSSMSPTTAETLQTAATAINSSVAIQAEIIFEIGQHLIQIKEILDHGTFTKWLQAEVGFSIRTGQNYMNAALKLSHRLEQVKGYQPSTIYTLSAARLDDRVRDEILDEAAADPSIGESELKRRVDEAKAAARAKANPSAKNNAVGRELADLLASIAGDHANEPCERVAQASSQEQS